MAEHEQNQKTEQPTENKLSEAIDRGQFAKSHELTVLFPFAAVLGVSTLTAAPASREVAGSAVGIGAMLTFGRAIGPVWVGIVRAGFVIAAAGSLWAGQKPDRILFDGAVGCLAGALLFRWFSTVLVCGIRETILARRAAAAPAVAGKQK